MLEKPPGHTHYPALDGLRGLAILLVVFYHNFGFINYFFFGWLGVDLFFVLSGYLITGILLRSLAQKESLFNFYMRRVLRIFPLYYLTLIFFLVVLPQFDAFKNSLQFYTENQAWLWSYLQNWLFIFKPAGEPHMLHHLWSLAVEEQFYILWPVAMFLIPKPRQLLTLLVFILAATLFLRCIVWINKYEDLAYFNLYTFSRIDGICIGCIIALLQQLRSRLLTTHMSVLVFTFAGLNFLFYFINRYLKFSFPYLALIGYTTFAMLFGLLVHEAAKQNNRIINIIFTNEILRFFGKISYGLYVFHWPMYVIGFPLMDDYFQNHWQVESKVSVILSSIIITFLSVIVSFVSLRYFESYFLKLKNRFA